MASDPACSGVIDVAYNAASDSVHRDEIACRPDEQRGPVARARHTITNQRDRFRGASTARPTSALPGFRAGFVLAGQGNSQGGSP